MRYIVQNYHLQHLPIIMLISFYLFGAITTFTVGLRAFLRDHSTPKSHAISWLVLFEATFFWPVVLPIAYLERQTS